MIDIDTEFRQRLEEDVRHGRRTQEQADDLLEQKIHFDAEKTMVEQQFRYRILGYVGGDRIVGGNVQDVLAEAKAKYPGRQVYIVPIELKIL